MSIRETILEILLQIVLDQKYSNLVLRTELNEQKEEDKRFATNVVYGTLQNQRLIRYQYEPYIQRGVYKDIAILLDMSVYQLLFMDKVPHYAIVNEAVEIAKKRHHGKFASVVNAILRNVIRNGVKEVEGDEWAKLAIETSHPDWIVAMWKKQYGEEVTRKLCVDNNNVPLNMARINRLVANEAQIQALGFHHFGDDCYTYEGAIAPTSAFQEGLVTIQDYASQKVAPFLNPQKGEMVLDACAAPGTKSVHMAQLMENTGKIVALDLHPHRVQLIQNSLNRLHVENVSSMAADATQLHLLYQTPVFDKILVDAPCTGYGVMKRKSDIKVHLKPEDMDEIIKIQAKILHSAAFVLKPGGVMVYSTCTLNKKENEQQVQKFLDSHQQFVLVEEQTIFPYEHECDGFYMAKILKKPNQE